MFEGLAGVALQHPGMVGGEDALHLRALVELAVVGLVVEGFAVEDAGTAFAKTRHAVELLGARGGGTQFEGTAVAGHGGRGVADLQGAGLERVAGAGLAVDAVGEVDFRQNLLPRCL